MPGHPYNAQTYASIIYKSLCMTLHPSSHYHRTIRSLIQVSNPWLFVCLLLLLYWVPCAENWREGPFHHAILLFFHPSILPYFHTSILPSFHSNHVSRPRGFCSCQGRRGPAGAYNISLVSRQSSNLHARIAILYTFLLPIHSDVLTNSTLIIYILQN